MSPTLLFALAAALILAVVLAFLLPPLWLGLRAPRPAADRQAANLAIFRDQLADLERERAAGNLAAADAEQASTELKKRLLEEATPSEAGAPPVRHQPTRATALALLVLLPLFSIAGYGLLGTPRALDPAQRQAVPALTPQDVTAMVDKLAARLQQNPDDRQGWLMLGRSYKALGRHEEAAAAYAKAGDAIDGNPDLLADYAEALALSTGKGLQGQPLILVGKALQIDPDHGHSLFLAGAAALESGDTARGIAYWEKLLPQVEPGSEIDQMLRQGIDKARRTPPG